MTRLVTRATTVNLGTTGMLSSMGGSAVAPRRKGTGHRLLAGLWRVLAEWPNTSTTGARTPRRTTSSAPACPVRSTAYERGPSGSRRVGLPAGALAGVDRRQVTTIRTLQVDEHALVAQ